MKMIYRGSMPAPKHNHGDVVPVGACTVVIQSREWTGSGWKYSGVVTIGYAVLYFNE